MRIIGEEELKEILRKHAKWLLDNSKGERADLCYVVGNMREVKSLQVETYKIAYTKDVMAIGCEQHSIEDWKSFKDSRIQLMDDGALGWWEKWKPILKQIGVFDQEREVKDE